MNPFVCTVDLRGAPIGAAVLADALPALTTADGRIEYALDDCWGAAWVPSRFGRPTVTRHAEIVAVGFARLDNPAEVRRALTGVSAEASDLELVAATFRQLGARGVRRLIGEVAVALWDARRHALFAVRDALGLRPLYYQRRGDRLTVGSHLECFDRGELDREYLRLFLTADPGLASRTVYRDVRPVEAGTWLVADGQQMRGERYWHPSEFEPASTAGDVAEAVEAFRGLFADAVAAQTAGDRPVWSQLSGGLDSSSVVGMACHLAEQGRGPALAGTVTVVDRLADGDETRFSDAVVARWGVPNHRVADYWAWQADGAGPEGPGGPRHFLPFFARDREICRQVVQGGGEVLLSGYGADQYLSGGYEFIADRIARGEYRRAVADLVDLAVTTRQSFWPLAWRYGLEPLAPAWLRRRPASALPAWVAGSSAAPPAPAPPGSWFGAAVARETAATELLLNRGPFERGLEVRYPFLHRPLVEFGLRLPAELRVRPHRQKWILREALADVLPRAVRERTGKGGIDARVVWSYGKERGLLRRLIADSHLAELGLVKRDELSAAFERCLRGNPAPTSQLFFTLSLETWLAVQSGWWARHAMVNPAAGLAPAALQSSQEISHAEAAVR